MRAAEPGRHSPKKTRRRGSRVQSGNRPVHRSWRQHHSAAPEGTHVAQRRRRTLSGTRAPMSSRLANLASFCDEVAVRVLFLFARRFRFRTHHKALAEAPDDDRDVTVENAAMAFVHAEPSDGGDQETKLVKNLKWVAGKFETKRLVLHYFSHLGEERLGPEE